MAIEFGDADVVGAGAIDIEGIDVAGPDVAGAGVALDVQAAARTAAAANRGTDR
jgi:hypothetical protein